MECCGPPCHVSVKISDTTISCSSLCEAVRLHAEMVIEDSYILFLSCVEKGKIKRRKLVTTSSYLADNCSDIPLSSYFFLAGGRLLSHRSQLKQLQECQPLPYQLLKEFLNHTKLKSWKK